MEYVLLTFVLLVLIAASGGFIRAVWEEWRQERPSD